MMGLPVLATMGIVGIGLWLLFLLCLVPLGIGLTIQLVLTAVTENRWIHCIPAGLGLWCLAISLIFLNQMLPPVFTLIYWAVYFLIVWLTWLVVMKIKNWIAGRRQRSE